MQRQIYRKETSRRKWKGKIRIDVKPITIDMRDLIDVVQERTHVKVAINFRENVNKMKQY